MTTPTAPTTKNHSAIGRFFRNPETSDLVVIQVPNLPLWSFIAASAADLLLNPHGSVGAAISVVSSVSLAVWAVAELARGASPFRRVLGAVILAGMVAGLVLR